MAKKHNRLWRSAISIALAISLVFGSVAIAFADTTAEQSNTDSIYYVSLGDSMTNGYGLTGYDNQGYKTYGKEAYPNQFAEWLEKETEKTVVHNQLAFSCMRVEDLLFTLDFPMKNGEPDLSAVALAERPCPSTYKDDYTWWNEGMQHEWYSTFTTGDFWTWNEFTNARYKRMSGGTAAAVKEYKKALTEADLISIGTGNVNFGVFALDQLTKVVGFGGTPEQTEWMSIERAMENCDPKVKPMIETLQTVVDTAIDSKLATLENADTAEMLQQFKNVLLYTVISYCVNYANTIDKFIEMNPDAEVILVGIMNTMAGVDMTIASDGTTSVVPMNELMGVIVDPVNAYIASLPAHMQEKKPELYGQAKFYYAEAPEVECLVSTFDKAIRDSESVVRQRFVEEIVDDGSGLIWNAVDSMFNEIKQLEGLTLQNITLADIEAYEVGNTRGFSKDKIVSCAIYLAFEDAIIKSSKESVIDITSMTALMEGFDVLIADISNELISNKELANITDVNKYAKVLPEVLSNIIVSDNTMQGLMHIFARSLIGSGLGAHPSVNGHNELAAAVIKSYSEDYTVADEKNIVMDELMKTLLGESISMFDSQMQIVNKLKKAVNILDSYAKAELDNFTENVKTAYAGKGLDVQLKTVEKELNEIRKAVKEAKNAIGTLTSAVNVADAKKIETATATVETKMNAVDVAVNELDTAVAIAANKAMKMDVDNDTLKAVASEMRTYAALAYATTGIMKSDSRQLAYAPAGDSYYVALGDASASAKNASNSYGRKIVKDLGMDYKINFSNESLDGLRVDDLLYILDENYEPDAYAKATFDSKKDKTRDDLIAEIKKADMITVGFSNTTMLDIAIGHMMDAFSGKAVYEIDWNRYLDESTATTIEDMMTGIEGSMMDMTGEMSIAGVDMSRAGIAVRAMIESYLYNYMGFYMNYQDAMNKIAEINPDAKLILIGISNPFNGTNLVMGEDKLPLGEYMGLLTDVMNMQQRGFAMMTGKAVYVEADEVEVSSNAYYGDMQLMSFISNLMIKGVDTLAPSNNGHTYIKDQIVSVMKVVDPATEAAMDQIADLYDLLYITPTGLSEADKQIKEARAVFDALTPVQKAEVNDELIQLLEFCEDDFGYVKVVAVGNSNVTNMKVKLLTKTKLTVSWTGVTGAQKYAVKIYRNGKLLKTVNTTKKSVSLTNIVRGCTYKVTVQPVAAVNGIAYTGIAKYASVTSNLDKANLTVKKVGSKATVKSKDQNSTGFQVWISTNKNFKQNVTKKTFKTNNGAMNKSVALKKGTNYIKVRAYTSINGKTAYGNWSNVRVIKR